MEYRKNNEVGGRWGGSEVTRRDSKTIRSTALVKFPDQSLNTTAETNKRLSAVMDDTSQPS